MGMKRIVLQMDDAIEMEVEAESGLEALEAVREVLGESSSEISEVEGIEGTLAMYCGGKTYVTYK